MTADVRIVDLQDCAGSSPRMSSVALAAIVIAAWAGLGEAGKAGEFVEPLKAAVGITAMSGRVLNEAGAPLVGVRVTNNATSTQTDAQGRFLLAPVPVGDSVVQIDARHAGAGGTSDYGFYELHAESEPGMTSVINFPASLTAIDHTHDVTFPSPTVADVVVSSPALPGLELVIPRGTVIRDAEGNLVTRVGITVVSPQRTPYPMPAGVNIPFAYTIQPSGACLYDTKGGIGYARIIYPNVFNHLPRARETFWTYEPDRAGWRAYGYGQVSPDGTQVIPDRDTVITDFYSAECDQATRTHRLVLPTAPPRPGVAP
jgi:hypothetical protein